MTVKQLHQFQVQMVRTRRRIRKIQRLIEQIQRQQQPQRSQAEEMSKIMVKFHKRARTQYKNHQMKQRKKKKLFK
jgi:hypothetical protein